MVVHPASHRIPRVRRYSRNDITERLQPSPTGISPSSSPRSSGVRLTTDHSASFLPVAPRRPSNPGPASAAASATRPVSAPPRSLAATGGILSLPPGTEMFQFPDLPPVGVPHGSLRSRSGVAPFGHPWIIACQRLPRAFRRVATSFLGHLRLGIHPVPSLIFLALDIHRGTRGRSALSRSALTRPHQVRSTCAHIELSMSLDIKNRRVRNPLGPASRRRRSKRGVGRVAIVRPRGHTRTPRAAAVSVCWVLADPGTSPVLPRGG